MWCVPKKGSPEYTEITNIRKRTTPEETEKRNVERRKKAEEQLKGIDTRAKIEESRKEAQKRKETRETQEETLPALKKDKKKVFVEEMERILTKLEQGGNRKFLSASFDWDLIAEGNRFHMRPEIKQDKNVIVFDDRDAYRLFVDLHYQDEPEEDDETPNSIRFKFAGGVEGLHPDARKELNYPKRRSDEEWTEFEPKVIDFALKYIRKSIERQKADPEPITGFKIQR